MSTGSARTEPRSRPPEGRLRIAIAKPRRGAGGGTTIALAVADGLRARGHEVVLLCHPRARIRERARALGIAAEPVLAGRDIPFLPVLRAVLALRRHHPDVLLAFMARPEDLRLAVPAAHWLGLPIVVRRGLSGPLQLSPAERRAFGMADRFVAVSHAIAAELEAALPGRDAAPTVVHNGTDLARLAGAPPAELGLPAGAVAIGFVGRLHREKGIRELGAAWRRVADAEPAAHLVVVGEGPHEAELRAALGDAERVHWLGYRNDTASIHRALDVFVLPTHHEGFPNAIVEALAAGTPVVSTLVDGPVEAVEDGVTGRLVAPGEPAALAAALIELVRDADRRALVGRAAAARARARFSLETMVDAYEALLSEVVRKARLGSGS